MRPIIQGRYAIGIVGSVKRVEMPVKPMSKVTTMIASVDNVSWTEALSPMNGSFGVLIVWITIVYEITPNMNQPHWK